MRRYDTIVYMNVKSLSILIVALALLGLGAFFVKNWTSKQRPGNQSMLKEINLEDKIITDDTKPLKIHITYPFIQGYDDFNAKAEKIIMEELNNFKKNALENDAAVKATSSPEEYVRYPREYGLDISYEKGEVNESIISVVYSVYVDTGGAHPNGYYISLNYDVKNNKEIALADLFANQPDYLRKISTYAVADLAKQVAERMGNTEGSWIMDGAGPKGENFSVFMINNNSLTFYFSPYQVAPYVAGDFKVAMPR